MVISGSCFIGRVLTDLEVNGDFAMQLVRDGSAEAQWVEFNNVLKQVILQSCFSNV